MTQDEIIEMARQAGFYIIPNSPDSFSKLVAFAKLVAAKEREACAKVCETNVWSEDVAWWRETTKSEVAVESSVQCAEAIRARGQV